MKAQTILTIVTIVLILLALSIAGNAQREPRNLQCRVFEITKREGRKVDCKALSMQGDTIHIKYGFRGWESTQSLKVGTWLTIHSDYSDKYCEWYSRKIFINY